MKKFLVLFAVVVVLLCVCAVAGAEDGWKKEGDYLYYYKNDVALTGTQTIDAQVYVFADNGALKGTGQTQGTGYGIVCPGSDNKLLTGWQTVSGKKYYFNPDDARATIMDMGAGLGGSKPCVIDGVSYLFGDDGALIINNWWTRYVYVGPYFHSDEQGRVEFGYHKYDDQYYYFNDNGISVEGFQLVGDKVHFFSGGGREEGYREFRGWRKVDKDWYYFDEATGAMHTGSLNMDGYQYQFSENGKLIIDKITFIVDAGEFKVIGTTGDLLTGWQTINDYTYWFETYEGSEKYGAAVKGPNWLYGPGEEARYNYYFDSDYRLKKDLLIKLPIDDKDEEAYFYYGSDGKRVTGWQTINGKKYYFRDNGQACTGPCEIEENEKSTWYYFNSEGVLQTNLLIKHFDRRNEKESYYYYDADGKRVYGWKTIDGNTYYFHPEEGYRYTGANNITEGNNNYFYYFDADGKLQKDLLIGLSSEDEKNKNYYYFGSDGKVISGWKTINGDTYYFCPRACSDGTYEIEEDGETNFYYFSAEGKLQKELLVKHAKRWETGDAYFYYGSDGKRVSGWKTINGDIYYFDKTEGAYTGVHTIDNVIYTFSDEGKLIDTLVPVTAIQFNKSTLELKPGYSEKLIATIYPDNATNKNVLWESEDVSIAAVDEKGEVTALTSGHTRIFARAEYNNYIAICDIHVEYSEPIETFVTRCYKLILNRNPDEGGLNEWCYQLKEKIAAAANIIDGFVSSTEFTNRNLSDEAKVDILYKTMMGRAADTDGKSGWVDALSKGYSLQNIIDGFCGSVEFTTLCNNYGIEPGKIGAPIPAAPDTPRGKIEAFVKRCYSLILSRDADQGGLQGWSDALESGAGQACQIIDGFVRSPEYINRNLSNAESVDILYKTMLNRSADEGGKAGWVDAMNQGYTLQHIINGFCGSAEFTAICDNYGIVAGSVAVSGAVVKREAITPEGDEAEAPVVYQGYNSEFINEEKIRAFVEHCYAAVFGREGDAEGIENYTALILNGKKTPKSVAREFVFSAEFQGKLPGNEEFIRILYRLYFDREPGAEELAGWVKMLEDGASLEEIVDGFAGSAEFKAIVNGMKQ